MDPALSLPDNPGLVVVGIEKVNHQVMVYAYFNEYKSPQAHRYERRARAKRGRIDVPWNQETHPHVLDLVYEIEVHAMEKGCISILRSSTVDFWEEAIA